MLRVVVLGATGRVGRLLLTEVLSSDDLVLSGAIGRSHHGEDAATLVGLPPAGIAVQGLDRELPDCDVVVDFSLPEALARALPRLGERALVSGTTGLDNALEDALEAQAHHAPVLTAANFSTGVNVLLDLVERAARALPEADIEIVESHHRHKVDAPSGTALALGRAAAQGHSLAWEDAARHGRSGRTGPRPEGEIGVHALRMGDVVGEHQVWLASQGDRVALHHVATSRRTFALGALRAARWVTGQDPGHYSMRHVLGLEEPVAGVPGA